MIELGRTARDVITGFEGVAIARTEWLYGCVRVTLQPRAMHEGKPVESQTFDEEQLEVTEAPAIAGNRLGANPAGPKPIPQRKADPR